MPTIPDCKVVNNLHAPPPPKEEMGKGKEKKKKN